MRLEMYLNDELLDSIDLSKEVRCTSSHVNYFVKEQNKKHQQKMEASGKQAFFYLSGIPSRINSFKPLG